MVGQEPAPSECVLLCTSKAVRGEMRGWVLSEEGDRWAAKLDVRDLGWHLDTTRRCWCSTLSARVRLVVSRLALIFVLLLDFHRTCSVFSDHVYPLCHLVEASFLSKGGFFELRAAVMRAVWSRKQPLASSGAVLGLLDASFLS